MGVSVVSGELLEGNQLRQLPACGLPLSGLFSLSFREWVSAIENLDFIFIGGCAGFFQVELRVSSPDPSPCVCRSIESGVPRFFVLRVSPKVEALHRLRMSQPQPNF